MKTCLVCEFHLELVGHGSRAFSDTCLLPFRDVVNHLINSWDILVGGPNQGFMGFDLRIIE